MSESTAERRPSTTPAGPAADQHVAADRWRHVQSLLTGFQKSAEAAAQELASFVADQERATAEWMDRARAALAAEKRRTEEELDQRRRGAEAAVATAEQRKAELLRELDARRAELEVERKRQQDQWAVLSAEADKLKTRESAVENASENLSQRESDLQESILRVESGRAELEAARAAQARRIDEESRALASRIEKESATLRQRLEAQERETRDRLAEERKAVEECAAELARAETALTERRRAVDQREQAAAAEAKRLADQADHADRRAEELETRAHEIEEKETEIDRVRAELDDREVRIEKQEAKQDDDRRGIEALRDEINAESQLFDSRRAELASQRTENDRRRAELEKREESLRKQVEVAQEKLRQRESQIEAEKQRHEKVLAKRADQDKRRKEHLALRRARLAKAKKLIRDGALRMREEAYQFKATQRAAQDVLAKRQQLTEVQQLMGDAEQRMLKRWAVRTGMSWAVGVLIAVCLLAGVSWVAGDRIAVRSWKASAIVTHRGVESVENPDAWAAAARDLAMTPEALESAGTFARQAGYTGATEADAVALAVASLTAEPIGGGELRLSLTGSDTDQLRTLLDAITRAYSNEARNKAGVAVHVTQTPIIGDTPVADDHLIKSSMVFGGGAALFAVVFGILTVYLNHTKRRVSDSLGFDALEDEESWNRNAQTLRFRPAGEEEQPE